MTTGTSTSQEIAGVRRVETVGDIVRGPSGQLSRITGVIETSRCSERHVSHPLDVVVTVEPVTEGSFNHKSAWASDLTPAKPGDVGAHADRPGFGWRYVAASWSF